MTYVFADDAKFYRHIKHPKDQELLQLANSNKCITSVVEEVATKS